ncbi:hypothetical protein GCM10023107_52800 [Actinoplanes octamycinicus]|nr:hypothetical protein Aoc01nite_48370 [Actinoplanes octamycinicus]
MRECGSGGRPRRRAAGEGSTALVGIMDLLAGFGGAATPWAKPVPVGWIRFLDEVALCGVEPVNIMPMCMVVSIKERYVS